MVSILERLKESLDGMQIKVVAEIVQDENRMDGLDGIDYDDAVRRFSRQSSSTVEEIRDAVRKLQDEVNGLLTATGALLVLAHDEGIDIGV